MITAYSILLLAVAASDFWRFRIPNLLILALAALFVVSGLLRPDMVAWESHLGAGLLMFGVGVALFALGLMGAGDSKLLAVTGLWTGLELLPLHLACTASLGLALIQLLLSIRQLRVRLVPAGPASAATTPWLPEALLPGRSIPYGIAIAGSAGAVANGWLGGAWGL